MKLSASIVALMLGSLPAPNAWANEPEQSALAAGECRHPDEAVTEWLMTSGVPAIASHACRSARLDWQERLVFYRDADGTREMVAFNGIAGEHPYQLVIQSVDRALLGTEAATGNCRMIVPETDGLRRIQCFARVDGGHPETALVEMELSDERWGAGEILTKQGRCESPGLAAPVLGAALAQEAGQRVAFTLAEPLECSTLQIEYGQSYRFTSGQDGDRGWTFTGNSEPATPHRLTIRTVIDSEGAARTATAGACGARRVPDGSLVVVCLAAVISEGEPLLIEAAFVQAGTLSPW